MQHISIHVCLQIRVRHRNYSSFFLNQNSDNNTKLKMLTYLVNATPPTILALLFRNVADVFVKV